MKQPKLLLQPGWSVYNQWTASDWDMDPGRINPTVGLRIALDMPHSWKSKFARAVDDVFAEYQAYQMGGRVTFH